MRKEHLIQQTIMTMEQLPSSKVKEVNEFAEFLLSQLNDQIITEGIQEGITSSKTFEFLQDEPDLYSVNDLKTRH